MKFLALPLTNKQKKREKGAKTVQIQKHKF